MNETRFEDFIPVIYYLVFRKCAPNWRLRPHLVDDYDLTYIIEGNARYTINGTIHELGPGDLLYLSSGVRKQASTYPQNLMHCFSVNFNSKYPSVKIPPPVFSPVNHIGMRQDIIGLFRELTLCWTQRQAGYIMKTRGLLLLILHRLAEILLYDINASTGDYRVNKVTRHIASHYSERLLVKNLASLVQLDTGYLGHLFRQETGMTIHQYITNVRVRNAETMLQSGGFKVYEVAEQCGFSDAYHFYKSFRSVRGFPPSRCIPRDTVFDDDEDDE
jgi:AraC-like DNA-binding protein